MAVAPSTSTSMGLSTGPGTTTMAIRTLPPMVASTRWDKATGSRRALRAARKDELRMAPRRANDDSTPSHQYHGDPAPQRRAGA